MPYNFLEIPMSAPAQRFSVFLNNKLIHIQLRWNEESQHWNLDFYDKDLNLVLAAVPLVTGVDLLAQHRHLEFGGGLIVQTDFDPLLAPTYDSLGDTSRCFFYQEVQ